MSFSLSFIVMTWNEFSAKPAATPPTGKSKSARVR